MKDVIGKAMMSARLEQQQQQQQHRQKRAVTKTDCEQPTNLETMFQQINSGVSVVFCFVFNLNRFLLLLVVSCRPDMTFDG